jgi:hypothetical protein
MLRGPQLRLLIRCSISEWPGWRRSAPRLQRRAAAVGSNMLGATRRGVAASCRRSPSRGVCTGALPNPEPKTSKPATRAGREHPAEAGKTGDLTIPSVPDLPSIWQPRNKGRVYACLRSVGGPLAKPKDTRAMPIKLRRREKVFGPGRAVPLDRNAKVRSGRWRSNICCPLPYPA